MSVPVSKNFELTLMQEGLRDDMLLMSNGDRYDVYTDATVYDDGDFSGRYAGSIKVAKTGRVSFLSFDGGAGTVSAKKLYAKEATAIVEVASALAAGYSFDNAVEEFGGGLLR